MGWGTIPDDHPLMAGMVGLQTSHRYGNATMLESDFVLGIGNRWANRHTGGAGHLHRGPHVRARRHRADPDRPGVRPRLRHRLRRRGRPASCSSRWPGSAQDAGGLPDYGVWAEDVPAAQGAPCSARPTSTNVPIKPQRVYEEMNRAFGRDTRYVSTIGLSQIAGAQLLHVYKPRHWINAGQAGPLGWTAARRARGGHAPTRTRPSSRCPATTTSSS